MLRLMKPRLLAQTSAVLQTGESFIRRAPSAIAFAMRLYFIFTEKAERKFRFFLIIKNSSKQTLSGIIRFLLRLADISPPTLVKTRILPRASRLLGWLTRVS